MDEKLRIKDAFKEDAGRGIVRIDPEISNFLNLKVGDIIKISHSLSDRNTVARLASGKINDKGKRIIRMDPSLRRNLKISIDDFVEIKKIEAQTAEKVTFAALNDTLIPRDPQTLTRKLENRVFTKGDNLSFYAMAHRIDLIVVDYSPKLEAVKISLNTNIDFSEKSLTQSVEKQPKYKYETISNIKEKLMEISNKVTYEDIGGLEESIQKVREIIELPIRHPELFERIGIEPPKGVLLYGPPGTGKTLLARAVAYETDAHFISVSGPEIMSKFFGQSEENLRNIFKEAEEKSPSIIFLDELDALASKREDGKAQVESRVVAQLLSLLDGLKRRGEIIVIGATNQVNYIDTALRRPGRFDREIEIKVPSIKGRLEILLIHTRGMPLEKDVDLDLIAEKTHGFVGADIKSLCKEAAMLAIREVVPNINLDTPLPEEILNNLKIKITHFLEALASVEPSALREVLITQPTETWDDIGGLEMAKQQLRETIEWPFKYPKLFEYMKSKPPCGILLFGLPGTGKTLLAKALAHETEVNFISIKGPEFLSKWVGESAKAVRETFRKARAAAPCIIFFDEIDAIAARRSDSSSSRVEEQVVAQLLTEMDGLEKIENVILIAATNRPDLLDPAILRSGRFGRHIEIPVPNQISREKIFAIHLNGRPLGDDTELNKLAIMTEGYTGADIKAICEEATILAIRRGIYELNLNVLDAQSYGKLKITQNDFEEAIEIIKKGADKAAMSYQKSLKETPEEIYR